MPASRAVPTSDFHPTPNRPAAADDEYRRRVTIESPAELPDPRSELIRDVRAGLASPPRHLSPKYLYDAEGSRIYEEITRLDEYYPFRTERGILTKNAGAIADASCPQVVIEFGSGAASKTRIVLDELEARGVLAGYGAIEVSKSALKRSLEGLAAAYPGSPARDWWPTSTVPWNCLFEAPGACCCSSARPSAIWTNGRPMSC